MKELTSLSEIRKVQAKLAEGNNMTARRLAIEEQRLQTISEDMANRSAAFEDAVVSTQRAAYQQAYDFAIRIAPFWLFGAIRRKWVENQAMGIKWHVDRVSRLEADMELERIKVRAEERLKEIAAARAAMPEPANPADNPPPAEEAKQVNLILPKEDLLVPNT